MLIKADYSRYVVDGRDHYMIVVDLDTSFVQLYHMASDTKICTPQHSWIKDKRTVKDLSRLSFLKKFTVITISKVITIDDYCSLHGFRIAW